MRTPLSALVLAVLFASVLPTFVAAQGLVSEDETYHARRDDCANLSSDHLYLDTRVGSDVDGCTLTFGWANEALTAAGIPLTYVYPQEDGASYLIDTAGKVEGRITVGGAYGAPAAGLYTVDVALRASYGQFSSTTLYSDTVEMQLSTGNRYVLDFEADIDDSLAGQHLRSFVLEVTPRGVNSGGPVIQSGQTYFTFPHLIDPDA